MNKCRASILVRETYQLSLPSTLSSDPRMRLCVSRRPGCDLFTPVSLLMLTSTRITRKRYFGLSTRGSGPDSDILHIRGHRGFSGVRDMCQNGLANHRTTCSAEESYVRLLAQRPAAMWHFPSRLFCGANIFRDLCRFSRRRFIVFCGSGAGTRRTTIADRQSRPSNCYSGTCRMKSRSATPSRIPRFIWMSHRDMAVFARASKISRYTSCMWAPSRNASATLFEAFS